MDVQITDEYFHSENSGLTQRPGSESG